MLVKDLIKELQKMPPEAEVLIGDLELSRSPDTESGVEIDGYECWNVFTLHELQSELDNWLPLSPGFEGIEEEFVIILPAD